MSNWGAALAGAAGAALNVGSQAIGDQIKQDQQAAAEQRAANLQLDLHQRMAAADEMMKNRAAERFATLTKQKMGEDVPVEAPSVDKTGLTDASSTDFDTAGGGTAKASFHGDTSDIMKKMQAVVDSPSATAEQKAQAQDVIDGIKAQTTKQADINAKSVDGKTRKRTAKEARDAAFDDAAQNDAPAFIAGQSMWRQAIQDETGANEKDADRKSREKIAGMQTDARRDIASAETARKAANDGARDATNRARIEAIAGGKGAKATALMQNVKMLEDRGYSKDEIDKFIFQTKDSSEAEKVFKMLTGNNNKYGELSLDDAVRQVRDIGRATGARPAGGQSGSSSSSGKVRTWNPATGKLE